MYSLILLQCNEYSDQALYYINLNYKCLIGHFQISEIVTTI